MQQQHEPMMKWPLFPPMQYDSGEISAYTPLVGLTEPKPTKFWVPPAVLVPISSLLSLQQTGRQYLPLYPADFKKCEDVRESPPQL